MSFSSNEIKANCDVAGGWAVLKPFVIETLGSLYSINESTDNDIAFKLFPEDSIQAKDKLIRYEDTYEGLLSAKGDGSGSERSSDYYNLYGKTCHITGNEYAEHDSITAKELTSTVEYGECGSKVIDAATLQTIKLRGLNIKRLNTKRLKIWNTLIYGYYTATAKDGTVLQEHNYVANWIPVKIQWWDVKNSTPLKDIRRLKHLYAGTIFSLDAGAMIIMNEVTFDCMISNQNPVDLGKTTVSACCEVLNQGVLNDRMKQFNLPAITVVESGYGYRLNGEFYKFVPDGYVIVIARHTEGRPLGKLVHTLHGESCGTSKTGTGDWVKYDDNCDRSIGTTRQVMFEVGSSFLVQYNYPMSVVTLVTGCTEQNLALA